MNLKDLPKYLRPSLLASILIVSIIFTPIILAFNFGQSAAGADYAVLEGVAGNDYYSSMQYSYKINEWAYNLNIPGYSHTTQPLQSIINPADVWFNASKSLRIGMTEYGEITTPQNAGIAYGKNKAEWNLTESWASSAINPKYWVQGWLFYVNYTRAGVARGLEAYALYSDFTTAEAGRKVYTWYSNYWPSTAAANLTAGSLLTTGVEVLYDSARLAVARTSVTIHDGFNNEDFARITFTLVFQKDTKYATVYKDVKILLDPKVLDAITDFDFSERYELDIARWTNPTNQAFIHYYHNFNTTVYQHPLTGANKYDVIQAFDMNYNYTYFAAYWPNATEYSVYSPLVPDVPHNLTRVLNPGTAIADIPSPPAEPSTPWVVVQWRYTYAQWPHLLTWLAKQGTEREIRFVEVVGMTDFNKDDPHPAKDAQAANPYKSPNQLDTEVWYLINQVFNPEDLSTVSTGSLVSPPLMWTGLGQSAATTDSAGAGFVANNVYGWEYQSFMLFDRNDTMFPWTAPVISMRGTIPYGLSSFGGSYYEQFSNSGKGTGTDTTSFKRTALNGFAFGVYDDVTQSPPQPIAGGWSAYDTTGSYWYPSKDPLTERWWNGTTWTMVGYTGVNYHPNGIFSLGGAKANGLTRYFNDFGYAISREGTAAYALINGGLVSGSAPTSDFSLPTFDYFPVSAWDSGKSTFGFKSGYAVISLVRDINGTRGLAIYGWDGRDSFWAAAWASQYVLGATHGWIPKGTVSLILKISYTGGSLEPTQFTVVKALGTITELGSNNFYTTKGFDVPSLTWTGAISIPTYPSQYEGQYVWWYAKLPTESTAYVEFDN